MSEKPILFCTEMVQAIFLGRKTQTRRIHSKPKYNIGDLLWVKETFRICDSSECGCSDHCEHSGHHNKAAFKANEGHDDETKWKPSLFMPKKYARLWLEVTNVRGENLQNITKQDALSEGISPNGCNEICCANRAYLNPITCFAYLWDSINGKDKSKSWAANPLVWVYEFKVISK